MDEISNMKRSYSIFIDGVEWHIVVNAHNVTGKCRMLEATAKAIAYEVLRKPIYWNDSTCKHWMYDFKCDGWWVNATDIDLYENRIVVSCDYSGYDGYVIAGEKIKRILTV